MPNSSKSICQRCNNTKIEVIPQGRFANAIQCSQCFTRCHLCDDLGYILNKDDLGREIATKCRCQTIKNRITLFNKAGIPSQFYDATYENFNITYDSSLAEALHQVKFLPKNFEKGIWKGLLFMGGVGVGKTRLVSSMVRDFTLNHNIPCLFKEFSTLLSEIKSGYDKGLSESLILDQISKVDILVIDELGKGRKTDWEISILDIIISSRYNMRNTTIFTTNYTDKPATTYRETSLVKGSDEGTKEIIKRETLEQRVYTRIYSRLKEMAHFVELRGGDHRQPAEEIFA